MCVCFVFGFQSKVNCVVLFVLCWFVEQLNCAVLFWFPEQVNCVLCESRERDREEVKVAFSVESAPTLFFFFVFWGGGVDQKLDFFLEFCEDPRQGGVAAAAVVVVVVVVGQPILPPWVREQLDRSVIRRNQKS